MAILTPYNAQIRELERACRRRTSQGVVISNVDTFQVDLAISPLDLPIHLPYISNVDTFQVPPLPPALPPAPTDTNP